MSSKKGPSHPKKKKNSPHHNHKRGRRNRNLREKWNPKNPDERKKRKLPIYRQKENPFYIPISQNKIIVSNEDYIEAYINELEQDVILYKKYGNEVLIQIIRHSNNLVEKLSESELPAEKLREYGQQYKQIKTELKGLGFILNLKYYSDKS